MSHSLKAKKKKKKVNNKPIEEPGDGAKKRAEQLILELRGAAEDAAKATPGGPWEQTSTDLLARLLSHQGLSPGDSGVPKTGAPMKMVGDENMDNVDTPKDEKVEHRPSSSDLLSSMKTMQILDESRQNRKEMKKGFRQTTSIDVFGGQRLNIFDVDKINKKKLQEATPASAASYPIFEERKAEMIKIALGGLPRNAFEEQIELTKQGKLWNFPVDNEQEMHEEKKFAFHEHVFLERHLAGRFPDTGPVRRFMELVCVGLSKNAFLTVPEKMAHIQWYSDYFREKQEILERELGEDGQMPEHAV